MVRILSDGLEKFQRGHDNIQAQRDKAKVEHATELEAALTELDGLQNRPKPANTGVVFTLGITIDRDATADWSGTCSALERILDSYHISGYIARTHPDNDVFNSQNLETRHRYNLGT